MMKSFVFRNSKSLSNAIGRGVTFSTILGSTGAGLPEAMKGKRAKTQSATANLIYVIKEGFELGVNAQPHISSDSWNLRKFEANFDDYYEIYYLSRV